MPGSIGGAAKSLGCRIAVRCSGSTSARSRAGPGYWALAAALFVGDLGLGLAAPVLLDVVLAGVPGRDAGSAGGVLSTVNEIGGAAGVAVLGTVFLARLDDAQDAAAAQPFAEALAAVLLWQVALYVLVAALVLLLPRAAVPPDDTA